MKVFYFIILIIFNQNIFAESDILKLSFTSSVPENYEPPFLSFSIELSSNFSNTNSIQLLYWPIGQDQTWVTLSRGSENLPFTKKVYLSLYAVSGTYQIRSIRATDNYGIELAFSTEELIDFGFNVTTEIDNPNSDSIPPTLKQLNIGEPYQTDDNVFHIKFKVSATDNLSGLQKGFLIEVNSPTGASLQKWGYFDDTGNSTVDFTLSEYSISGDYPINTIRIYDLAGNSTLSTEWLKNNNIAPISIINDNEDNQAPELMSFELAPSYVPVEERPIIITTGEATDNISGIKEIYIRLYSPDGSSVYHDKYLYYSHSVQALDVAIDSYISMATNYLPGEYEISYLKLEDFAGNSVTLYKEDLQDLNIQTTVIVGPINGACGISSGETFTSIPINNLCLPDTSTPIIGSGPWYWHCEGFITTDNCFANLESNTNCSSNTLIIDNIQYNENASEQSQIDIITNGNVAVENLVSISYQAPAITLNPGFHVRAGSHFTAISTSVSCASEY